MTSTSHTTEIDEMMGNIAVSMLDFGTPKNWPRYGSTDIFEIMPRQDYFLNSADIRSKYDKKIIECVRKAVEIGADVNARNAEGMSPIDIAILYDFVELAVVLLECGADPNAGDEGQGSIPLIDAINFSTVEMMEILFKFKADPNVIRWGQSAITAAIFKRDPHKVVALIKAGARVNPIHMQVAKSVDDVYGENVRKIERLLQQARNAQTQDQR